jgi:hypothetical protein
MSTPANGVPIEQFIQALTTQLDRAQTAMALKAENLDLPLTFALKDLSLDLRTHVDVVKSEVHIRPASAGEADASTLHLALTTITKPMIRENAKPLTVAPGDATIKEQLGGELTEDEQKRLEWAGVQTVSQLRKITQSGADKEVERVANLPVDRLRRALQRASQPSISSVESLALPGTDGVPPLIRIRGRNLAAGGPPRVSIGGEAVTVLKADAEEIFVAPQAHQLAGMLSIDNNSDYRAELPVNFSAPREPAIPNNGAGHSSDEAKPQRSDE